MVRARLSIICALGGLAFVSACETTAPAPFTSFKVASSQTALEPVVSAVYAKAEPRTVRRTTNDQGGEIPKAKPAIPVDDGGLGEIR